MADLVDIAITRDLYAPASARRAVERLSGRLAADVVPDVKLLVSELVTNSVKYGANGDVRLVMEATSPTRVRVEVVDEGAGFVPIPRSRPVTESGGWGLHLVETLTDRWGVDDGSAHVWFEIDRAA